MNILVDTNILLRMAQLASPVRATAADAVEALTHADIEVLLVPQVVYEFWVAATRPLEVNGLGMTPSEAEHSVEETLTEFRLLKDERGIFGHWRNLVVANDVKGKTAHDARLVAAMQRRGLSNLLTFNKADFTRFATIHVFTPGEILAGQMPA